MPAVLSNNQLSLNQNIILSRVVQGYESQQAKMVGRILSPKVPVMTRTGQIIRFDKSNLALYDTRRVPGAETNRRTLGYSAEPYVLCQDSLEGELPREVISESKAFGHMCKGRDIPFNLEKRIVEATMESLELGLEANIATKLTDPANYDPNNVLALTGADLLDDPNSDIIAMFNDIRERIFAETLQEMNTAVFSRKAFNAAINHPQIRAYFTGVSSEVVMETQLAKILRLETLVVSSAVAEDVNGRVNLWGNNIVAAYVPPVGMRDRLEQAFSYTYQLERHPFVEDPYYERNNKTWYYPVTDERETYIVNQNAGFLVQNATS